MEKSAIISKMAEFKNFGKPDEIREFPKGRLELVRLLEKIDRNIEPSYFKTENIIAAVLTLYVQNVETHMLS